MNSTNNFLSTSSFYRNLDLSSLPIVPLSFLPSIPPTKKSNEKNNNNNNNDKNNRGDNEIKVMNKSSTYESEEDEEIQSADDDDLIENSIFEGEENNRPYYYIDSLDDESINKFVQDCWKNVTVPRTHQWKTCFEIIKDIVINSSSLKQKGSSSTKNYLIQHAAGSGKSFTIASLTFLLHGLKLGEAPSNNNNNNNNNNNSNNSNNNNTNEENENSFKFQKILILNDRRHLDIQLYSSVEQFLKGNGVKGFYRPSTSKQLEKALWSNCRVIITTMQKFSKLVATQVTPDNENVDEEKIPLFTLNSVSHEKQNNNNNNNNHNSSIVESKNKTLNFLKNQSIAIITDESHRSHGKSITRHLHTFLTGKTRQTSQIMYFGFTCTPTTQCLEMFGNLHKNTRVPFYTYSMEEALKDGLILNVIENYTTVCVLAKIKQTKTLSTSQNNIGSSSDSSVSLSSTDSNNVEFSVMPTQEFNEGKRATYQLVKNTHDDINVLREKSRYIVNHLTQMIETIDYYCESGSSSDNPKKDGAFWFRGRAMLITSSRVHVLLYKKLIEEQISHLEKDKQFDVYVAFSPFEYEDKMVYETDWAINGEYTKYQSVTHALKATSKLRLIIVAEKFQTGFDEPELSVMYVDKRLRSSNAVQTLGRLSRIAPGKKAVYVVDFINTRREIGDSFGKYFRSTTLTGVQKETVLAIKLSDLVTQITEIPVMTSGDVEKCVDFILEDEAVNKQIGQKKSTIPQYLTHFLNLCDRLQVDNHPQLSYKFVTQVKQRLLDRKNKIAVTTFNPLVTSVAIDVECVGEYQNGGIKVSKSSPLKVGKMAPSKMSREVKMNVDEIVKAANDAYRLRLSNMMDTDEYQPLDENHPMVKLGLAEATQTSYSEENDQDLIEENEETNQTSLNPENSIESHQNRTPHDHPVSLDKKQRIEQKVFDDEISFLIKILSSEEEDDKSRSFSAHNLFEFLTSDEKPSVLKSLHHCNGLSLILELFSSLSRRPSPLTLLTLTILDCLNVISEHSPSAQVLRENDGVSIIVSYLTSPLGPQIGIDLALKMLANMVKSSDRGSHLLTPYTGVLKPLLIRFGWSKNLLISEAASSLKPFVFCTETRPAKNKFVPTLGKPKPQIEEKKELDSHKPQQPQQSQQYAKEKKEKEKEKEKEKDKSKGKERDHERDRQREREREKQKSKDKEREREREKERERDRSKEKQKEREKSSSKKHKKTNHTKTQYTPPNALYFPFSSPNTTHYPPLPTYNQGPLLPLPLHTKSHSSSSSSQYSNNNNYNKRKWSSHDR